MDASHGGSIRADRVVAAVTAPGPALEAITDIQEACKALEQEAGRLGATGDPIAPMISVFAGSARAINRLLVDATVKIEAQQEATGKLIQSVKPQISADDIKALNQASAANATAEVVHAVRHLTAQMFWRTSLLAGAALAVAFAAGVGAKWWVAPVRPLLQCQTIRGGTYCGHWQTPPTEQPDAPQTTGAKPSLKGK